MRCPLQVMSKDVGVAPLYSLEKHAEASRALECRDQLTGASRWHWFIY